MNLLTLILVLVAVGLVLWAINVFIPMQAGIKKLLNILVIIIVVLWVLKGMGIFAALSNVSL